MPRNPPIALASPAPLACCAPFRSRRSFRFRSRHAAARAAGGVFQGAEGGPAGEVSATWHALPFAGIYGAYQ